MFLVSNPETMHGLGKGRIQVGGILSLSLSVCVCVCVCVWVCVCVGCKWERFSNEEELEVQEDEKRG
jgi:hypothetical protein